MGTPDYMAPEQLNGQRADARADVWAFGVVLYEHACAPVRGAHCGSSNSTHLRRRHGPDPQPALGFARFIVNVIERSLSKSPSERYASAAKSLETWIVRVLRPVP